MELQRSPLHALTREIEKRSKSEDITIQEIVDVFGEDGHFLLILFFILPFLQPIPLFGLSTPFGLLISLIAVFFFLKKPPFVPKSWVNKKLSKKTVLKIAEGSEIFFKKLENILKPRVSVLFQGPFRTINTFLIVFNAVLLALPLPIPFSNAMPAWAILFQAIGFLERDGYLIIASYIQTVLTVVFFGLLTFGAAVGIDFLGKWIVS